MVDEYFQASTYVDHLVPEALTPVPADSTGSPFRSITQLTQVTQSPVIPLGVDDEYLDCEVAHMNNDPSSCPISSRIVVPPIVHFVNQPQEHNEKC